MVALLVLAEALLAVALASGCVGAALHRPPVLFPGALVALVWSAGIMWILVSPCYQSETCLGLTFGNIALLLWSGLGASLVMSVVGWTTRSGTLSVVAGAMSLVFCWAAGLSIGRFLVVVPLLDFAIGARLLLKASRTVGAVLIGIALALYLGQGALLVIRL